MSAIREKISNDMKLAMKARDQVRLKTIRMIKAEVLKKETASKDAEVDEQGLVSLLQSMKKQREDAIAQFEKGGRDDLADVERGELAIIAEYLPAQLDDDALANIVAETAAETGAEGMKAMGPLIKAVREKVGGQADGKRVSAAVKAHLG